MVDTGSGFLFQTNKTILAEVDRFELRTWELIWYSLIFIIGFPGNFIVCFVIIKSGPMVRNSPFNMLLMSLAVADMLIAAVVLPNYILSTSAFDHPVGKSGEALCKLFTGYGVPFCLALVSVYSMVAISIERMKAIIEPIRTFTRSSNKKTFIVIIVIWVVCPLVELPTVFGIHYSLEKPEVGNFCYYDWKYRWMPGLIYGTVFTVQFIIPFFIFSFTFYKIYRSIQEKDQTLQVVTPQENELHVRKMKKKKRTIKIVFSVVLAFFFFWTPNNVMYFLFQYVGIRRMEWNCNIYQFGVLMAFTNSCVNPFLYCFQSKDFRGYCSKAFKGWLFTGKRKKKRYKLLADQCAAETESLSQSTSSEEHGRHNAYLF